MEKSKWITANNLFNLFNMLELTQMVFTCSKSKNRSLK